MISVCEKQKNVRRGIYMQRFFLKQKKIFKDPHDNITVRPIGFILAVDQRLKFVKKRKKKKKPIGTACCSGHNSGPDPKNRAVTTIEEGLNVLFCVNYT